MSVRRSGPPVLLHFFCECRGAPARVSRGRGGRYASREGRPPLPHHFVCVETFPLTLPYVDSEVMMSQAARQARFRRYGAGIERSISMYVERRAQRFRQAGGTGNELETNRNPETHL